MTIMMAMAVAGVVVPAGTLEGHDGNTLLDRFIDLVEATVNQTLDDLSILQLSPTDIYGRTENGLIVEYTMLARAQGEVRLEGLRWIQGIDDLEWRVIKAIRDSDGSTTRGIANEGDLLRIEIQLAEPQEPREAREMRVEQERARPALWTITWPPGSSGELVKLQFETQDFK